VVYYHLANCKPAPGEEKPPPTAGVNGTEESGNDTESQSGRHLINLDWSILDFSKNRQVSNISFALPDS